MDFMEEFKGRPGVGNIIRAARVERSLAAADLFTTAIIAAVEAAKTLGRELRPPQAAERLARGWVPQE